MQMSKELETISEEQFLHNKLSFEINQELIHLMKRIIEVQQENKELKEQLENASNNYTKYIQKRDNKIDKIKSFIITNKPVYIEQKGKPCIIDVTNDLLEILKDSDVDG